MSSWISSCDVLTHLQNSGQIQPRHISWLTERREGCEARGGGGPVKYVGTGRTGNCPPPTGHFMDDILALKRSRQEI